MNKIKHIYAGHLENKLDVPEEETIELCKYNSKCNLNGYVCYKSKEKECQVSKFYTRYPSWEEMFI